MVLWYHVICAHKRSAFGVPLTIRWHPQQITREVCLSTGNTPFPHPPSSVNWPLQAFTYLFSLEGQRHLCSGIITGRHLIPRLICLHVHPDARYRSAPAAASQFMTSYKMTRLRSDNWSRGNASACSRLMKLSQPEDI